MFLDDRVGSIEVGKDADLAVWDRDPYTVPTAQLQGPEGRADAAGRTRGASRRCVPGSAGTVGRVAEPGDSRRPRQNRRRRPRIPRRRGRDTRRPPSRSRDGWPRRRPSFFPLWLRGRPGPDARMPMVGWFDPAQLLAPASRAWCRSSSASRATAASCRRWRRDARSTTTTRSTTATARADRSRRQIAPRDELWIDFICDTGDGWNPTYAVAYAAAQRALRVARRRPGHATCRAATCWCSAATRCIRRRAARSTSAGSCRPYTAAFGDDEPAERPHVYAMPGNHDWYDGLSAFTRLFCSDIGGRRFAGWWTRQRRSYFVAEAAAPLVAGRQRRPAAERPRRAADGALPRDRRPLHAAGRQGDPVPVACRSGSTRRSTATWAASSTRPTSSTCARRCSPSAAST